MEKQAERTQLDGQVSDVDRIRERVIEELRTVYDPEIPVNIFELGMA